MAYSLDFGCLDAEVDFVDDKHYGEGDDEVEVQQQMSFLKLTFKKIYFIAVGITPNFGLKIFLNILLLQV